MQPQRITAIQTRQPPRRFAAENTSHTAIQNLQKPLLFVTDLDECLLDWKPGQKDKALDERKLAKIRRILTKNRDRLMVGINTARSLEKIKKLTSFLQGFPVDVLVLENGQSVFWNTRQKPVEQWLSSLSCRNADAVWQRQVVQSGWRLEPAKSAIRNTLLSNGFIPVEPGNPHSPLTGVLSNGQPAEAGFFSPGMSTFHLTTLNPRRGTRQAAEQMAGMVLAALRQNRLAVDPVSFAHRESTPQGRRITYIFGYRPQGINKKTALDYVASRLPGLQAVITAGDNPRLNDGPMLKALSFQNAKGRTVPNFPILAGTSRRVRAMLAKADYPRVEYTSPGNLEKPLRGQLCKIDHRA